MFPVTIGRGRRGWLVTRYDDVLGVLKNDELFVKNPALARTAAELRKTPRIPAMFRALEQNLLGVDGTAHERLKVLVHKAFTPSRVERMREETQLVADAALDRGLSKGSFDLVADYALQVPVTIISRILGVPISDRERFAKWTRAFLALGQGGAAALLHLPSMIRFMGFIRRLVERRRHQPQDDLISALVVAHEGSDSLTNDEVVAMIFLLFSAGHETTVNLIASGMLALFDHPEELARLRNDERAFLKTGVEELVRYVTPAEMASERYAREDTTVAGVPIGRGNLVLAGIAAANRDEAHFERAEHLDVGRRENRHLSFGQGVHYCLGAPLSRLEGQIAIATLLRRAPGLKLHGPRGRVRWRPGYILRGLVSLEVSG